VPTNAGSHVQEDLGSVVVPAPGGQKAGLEGEIGLLADTLIEDRPVDRLDGAVDGRGPTVGSKEGKLTLNAIVSVSPTAATAPRTGTIMDAIRPPLTASAWRRVKFDILALPVGCPWVIGPTWLQRIF